MRVTKKPDERREEIVAAARELFALNGFVKTTVSDIAGKLGIAKGLFYYYFRTKDDVMNAVIEGYIEETSKVIHSIVEDKSRGFTDRLNAVVFTMIRFSSRTSEVFAELKGADRFMFHQGILERAVERFQAMVAGLVEEGVRSGVICCRHPSKTVEILFYGFGMAEVATMDQQQVVEIVEQALCMKAPGSRECAAG